MKEIKDFTILVVGAGTMGNSIAQVFAANGHKTYLSCRHQETLDSAKEKMNKAIDNLIKDGMANESYRQELNKNLYCLTTDKLADIGKEVDFVFETIAENPSAKHDLYANLNNICRKDIVLASNTSGMDIFDVCKDCVDNPERLIIAHWFNPPHLMKLIEVVCGEKTSQETVDITRSLLESVGKKPAVLTKFIPGFVVNRLATTIIREMYYMIDQGWISAEDAENAMRYTDGLRWGFEGPLALWDFVGLEIPMTVAKGGVLKSLCNDSETIPYGEKLLKEGKTGCKAHEGALKWGDIDKYVEKRSKRIIQMTKVMEQWDKEDENE